MERDNRIDALKGVLITLVVLGHCLLWGGQKSSVANWIYLFHMPFFVFLSGYLSHANSKSYWKGVLAVAESYIVYQLIKGVLYGYSPLAMITTPAPMMWYLFALIVWRCLYYIWSALTKNAPPKILNTLNITVAFILIVLGLGVGFIGGVGKTFAFSRMIVFAPFFWLGTMVQGKDFIGFCKRIPQWVAVGVLIITLAFIVWLSPQEWINVRETVRGVNGYETGAQMIGLASRAMYYLLATIISIALTSLIVDNKIISRIGKDSLKYYLFHGLILWFMSYINVPWNWWLSVIYCVIIMVAIYLFNMLKLSDILLRPIHGIKSIIVARNQKNV